ncbi:D-2-hydroxyacid dehydrogenase [Sediminibacillus massiliensis]|uniref:D-2-hydroxyacid dehydrogenase n=1 Tax=Sediminibacillus massiliensis TaxID=1926277 RepID=UPI00098851EB|nr:D-2-hydroxyacid dehydrogenase [Sediminibacillus massiliensis]
MKRKLVIGQELSEELYREVADLLPDEWEIFSGKDSDNWKDQLQEAEIIAGWNKNMEPFCLTGESKLKWIQSWSAGVDNFPLERLAEKDILLTSANGVHAYPISETIFGLMLALTRKIHSYVRNQIDKKWHHAHMNLELHEKTVGILGMGAIGKETAKISKAFGMKVIGVRNSDKPDEYADEIVKIEKLADILPECDYIVVTLPLTKDTKALFGREQFQAMKDTSFFINIGRGEIVDEQAMIKALQENQIAGAGLDVFEQEPLPESSPLWEMENVIITPHTAGSNQFYDQRLIEDIFVPNLKKYLEQSNPDINLVDYKKGY